MTIYIGAAALSGLGADLIRAAFGAFLASILAWIIGTRIAYRWEEIRRRRESDLAARNDFYRVYGEFFSTWKLWETYLRNTNIPKPEEVQWSLLERASSAEGGFEALLVKLASERTLDEDAVRLMACFRQAYQQLRQQMREGKPLDWWTRGNEGAIKFREYQAFKALAEYFATHLAEEQTFQGFRGLPRKPQEGDAIRALLGVTAHVEDWLTTAERYLKLPNAKHTTTSDRS